MRFRDARPIVLDQQNAMGCILSTAHRDRAFDWAVPNRVLDQVVDQIAQKEAVACHFSVEQLEPQIDAPCIGLLHEVLDRLCHEGVQCDQFEPGRGELARLSPG